MSRPIYWLIIAAGLTAANLWAGVTFGAATVLVPLGFAAVLLRLNLMEKALLKAFSEQSGFPPVPASKFTSNVRNIKD